MQDLYHQQYYLGTRSLYNPEPYKKPKDQATELQSLNPKP